MHPLRLRSASLLLLTFVMMMSLLACGGRRRTSSDTSETLQDVGDQTGDSSVPQSDREAFDTFMAQVPQALCDHYLSCGAISAGDLDACVTELAEEVLTEASCDALVTFFTDNRAAAEACLDGSQANCDHDDFGSFCPIFASVDMEHICDETPDPVGTPGARCESDSECNGDMLCLPAIISDKFKYCSPSCETTADCSEFSSATTSMGMMLPERFVGQNQWRSDRLARGVGCEPWPDDGSDTYCQFLCQEWAAMEYDEDGNIYGCACWPNHRWDDTDSKGECVWDASQECSLFTPCVPAQTTDPACSGELSCLVNDALEGVCVELMSGSQIEACVASCQAESCDSGCLSNCSSPGGEVCVDHCCQWSCE